MSNSADQPHAPDAARDVLLEMRGIHIDGFTDEQWYNIVRGVDLTVRRGEVLGLVGESGAGKSTLGLAAMGFMRTGCRLNSGSIRFDGVELAGASDKVKRQLRGSRIAYVAQSAAASFNPAHRLIRQTIESSVQHGLKSSDAAGEDAREIYRILQLPEPESIGERYPHQLSGGQLQRVMAAAAMLPRPDLIIFDEPTTALDVTTQVEVLAAFRHVVKHFNTAAIYITHDLAVVAQMADQILVLRNGRAVETAGTKKMLTAPEEDYTRSLWAVRTMAKPEQCTEDVILSVDGVDAGYGSKSNVLSDVSIRVPRGRTVSVVGESGSGKSTLGRVITGLLQPQRGRVTLNGEALPPMTKNRSLKQLRKIQMIYQSADTAMNPRQRVHEIIGRPLELYLGKKGCRREERILELLQQIDLDERFYDRFPGELSGGEKQRVCVARALAAEPDLIVCDEVTSALDQLVQEGILRLLLRLQSELGLSYLFITHDLATARAISDEIIVMNRGEIVEQGMKSQVLVPPFPPYTERLLSSVPEMDPDWLTKLLEQRRQETGAELGFPDRLEQGRQG